MKADCKLFTLANAITTSAEGMYKLNRVGIKLHTKEPKYITPGVQLHRILPALQVKDLRLSQLEYAARSKMHKSNIVCCTSGSQTTRADMFSPRL